MSGVLKDSNPPKSDPPYGDLTGVILAGGKSRRYGSNKALVKIDGIALIERVLAVVQSLFQYVIIITNTPEEYAHLKLPMHEDIIKDLGPLGGIYTGLKSIQDAAGFFVACDMPFLNSRLIRHMANLGPDYDAVVPRMDWKLEALHAYYGKSCLPAIEANINSRQYQVIRFFDQVGVRYVDEEEIRAFDPDLRSFLNVNVPQELSAAEEVAT